jgi:beta-lactamase regulating signal transducer with metallopeptidase domain
MIEFLKEKLGYGLAGFFLGLVVVTVVAKAVDGEISGNYLWMAPIGFLIGLFMPKQITSKIFFNYYKQHQSVNNTSDEVNHLKADQVQNGAVVYIVYFFGISFLLFLSYLIFISYFR